ncbi:hypothetical protein LPJ66_001260 [Kickxella alabastrina]|uniref:Uncharacterized protein n=1 Tax=Kickxella alabastrina TaxID=61397 RepID=A0ACC1ITS7_9FUNG|nr:hypothetical protein LPJ66_001260 [Kickxella alabastrina]
MSDSNTSNDILAYTLANLPTSNVCPNVIDADIIAMVNNMTFEEKIGQTMIAKVVDLLNDGVLDMGKVKHFICNLHVGAFYGSPGIMDGKYSWYSPELFSQLTDAVQKFALEHGLRVPIIWGLDSVRGANFVKGAVIFPTGIATAATFNPQHAYNAGRIAAKDTRAAGVHWAFAPVCDLILNKTSSGLYESFVEDPFLSSHMTAASVNGYQGDYKCDRSRVAACVKHFVGCLNVLDEDGFSTCEISKSELFEYFIPPFKAAINVGVVTMMANLGSINEENVISSDYYLQQLLREQLGFRGVLTAYVSMNSKHKFESIIRKGAVDTIVTDHASDCIVRATETLDEDSDCIAKLNVCVARILQLKKDLGLFESPYADPQLASIVGSAQDIEAARNVVRESVTLLKNRNNVLPLKLTERVLFLGPTLNSTRYMGGGWNGPSDNEGDEVYQSFGDTILEGVQEITGCEPLYFKGVDIDSDELIDISAIVKAAKKVDKILIGLGEKTYAGMEGKIDSLKLPPNQLDIVYTVARATHKPIVVVLVGGRPRLLERVADIADGIVQAYLPGTYGGLPIAEILYGKVNPSGRLPYTYPATEAQALATIWNSARADYKPQWAFGYGIGYSHVEYTNFTLSSKLLTLARSITVSVSITNHGPYPQKEPVFLFTSQPSIENKNIHPYRLRIFAKVELRVNETKNMAFELRAEDLAFWATDSKQTIDPAPVLVAINPYTQKDIKTEVTLDVSADAASA